MYMRHGSCLRVIKDAHRWQHHGCIYTRIHTQIYREVSLVISSTFSVEVRCLGYVSYISYILVCGVIITYDLCHTMGTFCK